MNAATLYHEIRTLPPDERLRLAHQILHDLVEPPSCWRSGRSLTLRARWTPGEGGSGASPRRKGFK